MSGQNKNRIRGEVWRQEQSKIVRERTLTVRNRRKRKLITLEKGGKCLRPAITTFGISYRRSG